MYTVYDRVRNGKKTERQTDRNSNKKSSQSFCFPPTDLTDTFDTDFGPKIVGAASITFWREKTKTFFIRFLGNQEQELLDLIPH